MLIFYSECKSVLIFYSSKCGTVSNFLFQNMNQLLLNFLCKHTISWSYFFIIFWIILNMFQMLVLIMFKTSRFWPLVLPDDDDANTIKVAYSHTRITHITGVGVYRVIEGCSALPALGLLDHCKSETQSQLSRCGGVIRLRFGLLHLGLTGQLKYEKRAFELESFRVHSR